MHFILGEPGGICSFSLGQAVCMRNGLGRGGEQNIKIRRQRYKAEPFMGIRVHSFVPQIGVNAHSMLGPGRSAENASKVSRATIHPSTTGKRKVCWTESRRQGLRTHLWPLSSCVTPLPPEPTLFLWAFVEKRGGSQFFGGN